jgi:hypothetical protein
LSFCVASLIMGGVVFFCKGLNLFLSIAVGIIIYLSVLFGFKLVSIDDLFVLLNNPASEIKPLSQEG